MEHLTCGISPIAGETICFTAIFRDWEKPDGSLGDLIDPEIIRWILYDSNWRIIHEESIGTSHRSDIGKYNIFYAIEKSGVYYYEWWGEHNSLPIVERNRLEVRQLRRK